MPYFLEVPLSDDQVMRVEVTGQVEQEDGLGPVGRRRDVVGQLPEVFTAGLDRAQAFATEVLNRFRDQAQPPDTVAVEFGLKLSARAGLVVAEATGEAHLRVTLEWRRPEATQTHRRPTEPDAASTDTGPDAQPEVGAEQSGPA